MLNCSNWKKIEKATLNGLYYDDNLKNCGIRIAFRPMPLEIKGMAFYFGEKYVLDINELLSDYDKQITVLSALVELDCGSGNVIVRLPAI